MPLLTKNHKTGLFALFALLLFTKTGCGIFGNGDDTENTFLIQVESIITPETVAPGDTVVVNFFGTIGSNGCFYFSHFESFEAEDGIEIEARGGYNPARACAAVIVDLDGKAFRYVPETTGTKIIRALRPEGGALERIVYVE